MIRNAKTLPKIYFGLHMMEGVAEYREKDSEPYRIFIGEETIKQMDPTFAGRPVYVDHVLEVDLAHIQEEADGYVIESFYNKSDGKHWAKFIVVSDRGHEAISKGYRLSNAYNIESKGPGGLWHGVEYQEEIRSGRYNHLAIVRDPRYDESIILTPEEFKEYNKNKEEELQKLTNEKEGEHSMLFFKRSKVENSADLENTLVELPKTKKQISISELVKNADEAEMKKGEPKMANEDDMVDMGNEEKMSVKDLKNKYNEMLEGASKMCNDDDENLKEESEKQVKKNKDDDGDADDVKKNEEKKEADEAAKEMKKNELERKQKKLEELKNAHLIGQGAAIKTVDTSLDQLARGKSRYGSAALKNAN